MRLFTYFFILLSFAVTGVCESAPAAESEPRWKTLSDYPRPPAPDTGWGIHDHTNGDWLPPDPDAFFKELKGKYGFSWFKILALGTNKLEMVKAARKNGVEPVVRLYVAAPLPHYPREGAEETEFRRQVREYVKAGARYFEFANEPNLDDEWAEGYKQAPNKIELLCKHWLRVRPMVDEEGGIPVFYAMTPGSAGEWWRDCFETFKRWGKIEEAFAGAAYGGHFCTLNHPIDYPFDPKKNMPHATKEERLSSLMQDNSNFRAVELLILLMEKYLPQPVPILGTEGGTGIGESQDSNYPTVTLEMHTDMNMDIFRRMNPAHPKYWGDPFFGQMSWTYGGTGQFQHSSWFMHPEHGKLPILKVMEKEPKFDRGKAFQK